MPKTLPFVRNPNSARARRDKTMLLPMPRATADELALRAHLALATMRAGVGSVRDAQTLTQTMILTGFIAEAGYGAATYEQLVVAEAAISAAFDRGRDTGEWRLDEGAASLFAAIVRPTMNNCARPRCGPSPKRANGSTASRQARRIDERTASWLEPVALVRQNRATALRQQN